VGPARLARTAVATEVCINKACLYLYVCWCSPAEAAGTLDWEDPYGKELNTSGIKAYGRAKLQVSG
jgi:hypothetical protein